METYKILVLVTDAVITLLLLIAILFADWEWLFSEDGLAILPIVMIAMIGFIVIMIGITYWGFVMFDPKTMDPGTPRTVYMVGLVVFLIGALLNVLGVVGGDLTMTILGAILLIIGAIIYIMGFTLKKHIQ